MRNPWWIGLLAVALWAGAVERAWAADGYGKTEDSARRAALLNAQDEVLKKLQAIKGPDWQPISGQLNEQYLLDIGVIRPIGTPEQVKDSDGSLIWWVQYEVELTHKLLKQLGQEERQQRMIARYGLAGRVLAGLVVLLLVTTGYLRLELLTAGYYTRLLRVGAVALVALAGIGLWLSL
jgi:hypothetical protein